MDDNCLFCKIINGDILAFRDIAPAAPVHFLVIPKKHITGPSAVSDDDQQLLGKMMQKGSEIARQEGVGESFRVVFNNGAEAGQTVFHLHMHILGGRALTWPPG